MPAKNDNAVIRLNRGAPFAGKPRSYGNWWLNYCRGRKRTVANSRFRVQPFVVVKPNGVISDVSIASAVFYAW